MKRVWILLAVVGVLLSGMTSSARAGETMSAGTYHVRVRSIADVSGLLADFGLDDANAYTNDEGTGFFATVSADTATALRGDARVLAINAELAASIGGTQATGPNNGSVSWGLDRIDSPGARDGEYNYPTDGWGVRVYVVDTGVRADHQEFEGRVVDGWSFKNDSQALSSYIAQNINCPSETKTLDLTDKGTFDLHGHGTHVAGTVAGVLTGVAKKATIVPVRAMDRCGYGTVGTIDRALDWILSDPNRTGPAVVNMSLGISSSSVISELENGTTGSIPLLLNAGVVLVAAAGNGGLDGIGDDAADSVPARTDGVISVAASDDLDEETPYSNYGPSVDLFAPGDLIWSAGKSTSSSYSLSSGTSMASPHVAGAAALRRSCVTTSSQSDVETWVRNNAATGKIDFQYPLASDNSPDRLLQVGMSADTRPCAPTQVAVASRLKSLVVSWVAPTINLQDVVGYTVVTDPPSNGCIVSGSSVTSCEIVGLTEWQKYSVTVSADGVLNDSTPSIAVTATPIAPTIGSMTPLLGGFEFGWSKVAGANSYTVSLSPGNASCTTSLTSCTITGLDRGSTYSARITATGVAGTSSPSVAVSATTGALPAVPSGITTVAGLTSVTVSWSAVSDATQYSVLNSSGAVVCTTTQTSCVINNLGGGLAYSFTVSAANAFGNSATATPVTATPDAQVGIVPSIRSKAGNKQVTLTWSAATGNDLTYVVARNASSIVCVTRETTCTVTGLANGKSFTFGVIARNNSSQSTTAASLSARAGFTIKKASVKRSSRTLLTSLVSTVSNGRKTWSEKGSCSIVRGRLVAAKKKTSCTVTLRVAKTSKYPAMSTSVSISVL